MNRDAIAKLYSKPLLELLYEAQSLHRRHFDNGEIQLSTLMSVKTGGCPEDCAYCPQSAHHQTATQRQALSPLAEVLANAHAAKQAGATRFCMGAAWRQAKDGPDFDAVIEMVKGVRATGLEVCCTLGLLTPSQAGRLKEAGLDYYNHNIDSSRRFYSKIISTRGFDDRLRTIENVRGAGIHVCTGGIIGMGETPDDRIDFLHELRGLSPESVTINALIPVPGTPLAERAPVSASDLARVIAVARLCLPKAMIRLSAGRRQLSEEGQLLCFMAGANSVFLGSKLLTADNPSMDDDRALFHKAGLRPASRERSPS